MKPRGVAVNHPGLWSPGPGFESPRGYAYSAFARLQRAARLLNDEIRKIIGRLVGGLCQVRVREKKGAGRKQKIYFLFPYGEEAYRQRFGEYPDVVRARRRRRKITHEEMMKRVVEALGIQGESSGRFDIIAEDGPIEIETGSNRNDQIYENIRK